MGFNTIKKVIVAAALLLGARANAGVDLTPTLKVQAEERYDDDLLLRAEPGANGGGQLMTKLSPQAGVEVKTPTSTTTATYAVDFAVRHGSGNTSLDHRGRVDFKKALSQRLNLDADMRIWRVSDPTSLPRLGMARTLSPILYGKAAFAGHYLLTPRWTATAGYQFEGARIYDPQLVHGGVVHAPYAEMLYKLSRRSEIGARYRLQYFAFGTESADASAVLAEYRYRINPVTTFTGRAGPAYYRPHGANAGVEGFAPVVDLELERQHEYLDLGLVAGHDLVGASGFTSALWADFASFIGSFRIQPRLSVFWAASFYRNGAPANVGFDPFTSSRSASGYALGGGVEWKLSRAVALQGTFDRLSQLAGPGEDAGAALSRNIVAARLSVTAF